MKTKSIVLWYLFMSYVALFTGCSGGDVNVDISGPDISPFNLPWTDEPITAYGVNTGEGRITVNDVGYGTSQATIMINGQVGTVSDLRRGQVITIRGQIYGGSLSGTAERIVYDARVIGPVESLDGANDQLIVMGQTVITGADTFFAAGIDPDSYAGLSVGTNVEVSGFARADGAILATRIDLNADGAELQLIGEVANLDVANLLFTVNRLTVDYSAALVIDLPGGAPGNGMTVRMVGNLSGGRFVVARLAGGPALTGVAGQRVRTAGLVTRFGSTQNFDVNQFGITTNSRTVFFNGNQGDLVLNAELVVDGHIAADGRITADRVTFGRLLARTETLSFALSDFDEIAVSSVFSVTVVQGDEFVVEVSIDDDDKDRVVVAQTGSRLHIMLESGTGNIHTLQAFIKMPVLERIETFGTIAVTLKDFDQAQMAVDLGGVSVLEGNALRIENLTANVSGVSVLSFGNIRPIGNADIDVSGVSVATLNMDVGSTLTGTVGGAQTSGISSLFYYGTNVNLDLTAGSLSSVLKLGETKP